MAVIKLNGLIYPVETSKGAAAVFAPDESRNLAA